MKVVFCGDVFLGGDLEARKDHKIVNHPTYDAADRRVANLEQPISDNDIVADKSTLYTGTSALRHLKDLQLDAVSLANNHVQDKGLSTIAETKAHLQRAGVGCFGAGDSRKDAVSPVWLTDDLVLLGYCEFGKPYIRQVEVSGQEKPGVGPLRREQIWSDLEKLPEGAKAILYFHWGREHVWFPPQSDIENAKDLLRHEKVALILGMHAHRPQGYIEFAGKRAYMSLGNFIFPNFFICPPTQLCYPCRESGEKKKPPQTRRYHSVSEPTYKKWKLVNRLSLIISYDSETGFVKHDIAYQKDRFPEVVRPDSMLRNVCKFQVRLSAILYTLPPPLYAILEKLNTHLFYFYWNSANRFYWVRRKGFLWAFAKTRDKFRSKFGH